MIRTTIAALLLLASPLSAQTVEERLAKLESEVRELREENRALRAQLQIAKPAEVAAPKPAEVAAKPAEVAAKPADVTVKPVGKEAKLSFGGLVQAQAEAGGRVDARFPDDNDRIFLRRARLNGQGVFAEHFDFKVELDLAGSLGASSGMRAQASDAYVTWLRHPGAKVRVGQFKTPFGFENLYSDQRLPAPERTLGNDRLVLSRQVGAQLFGSVAKERFSYAVGAFNGTGTNTNVNDDEGFVAAGRVAATLFEAKAIRWSAGVNGYRGEDRNISVAPELGFANNTFRGERNAFGVDTQLMAGPFELWVERLQARFDPELGNEREATAQMILGSWSITDRIQAVARWDELEANDDTRTTWLFGTNYFIKGHDLKLQLHWMKGENESRLIARLQTIF